MVVLADGAFFIEREAKIPGGKETRMRIKTSQKQNHNIVEFTAVQYVDVYRTGTSWSES
jgi:hypothetical protein